MPKTSRTKILLADPDTSLLSIYEELLEGIGGFETTAVQDGQEALACLAGGEYDLALMDIRLPELDGLQCIRHLQLRRCPTPVILTASVRLPSLTPSFFAGTPVTEVLWKPVELWVLLCALARALDLSGHDLALQTRLVSEGERMQCNRKLCRLWRHIPWLRKQGNLGEAINEAVLARNLARSHYGPRSEEYGSCTRTLGELYFAVGDRMAGMGLIEQAFAIRRELGNLNRRHVTALREVAALYRKAGYRKEAVPLLREALDTQRALLGPSDPDSIRIMDSLGTLLEEMEDLDGAEALHHQALRLRRESSAERPADPSLSLTFLARVCFGRDCHERSEILLRQALVIRRKVLGKGHPKVAKTLKNLAYVKTAMGDHLKAELLYRKALEILADAPDKYDADFARTAESLAQLYTLMGREEEARELMNDVRSNL